MSVSTTTARHAIVRVEAFGPSEPGALAGHRAVCSCGSTYGTSLSAREAARLGEAHVAWTVANPRPDVTFPCGLCGSAVTDALLDAGLHACCGCGFRDPSLDGSAWACPVCNPS